MGHRAGTVTADSGIVTGHSGQGQNRSRWTGIRGHDPPESPVTFGRNRRSRWTGIPNKESANKSAPTPPKARKASKALSLTDWLAQVAAAGEKAIPNGDPVCSYAAKALC